MREMGNEFAQHFPKIGGRLGMENLECADPYVERLLEGFAFLRGYGLAVHDAYCSHTGQYLMARPNVIGTVNDDRNSGCL